ncbi:MAG: hypothetical protein JWP89_3008 [Schlesneria sp.]|nr:hypothetical protein [Schlesneria sp.]
MNEQEALELIDAHLDDDHLTDQQVEELSVWLRENPQHAEHAFFRIFLHSFLRRRLKAQRLTTQTDCTDLALRGAIGIDASTELHVSQPTAVSVPIRRTFRLRQILLGGAISISTVLLALLSMIFFNAPPQAKAIACDGFDYPATSIPAPAIDSQTWPKRGGTQGLNGGTGWAEPWQESGSKVSVIIDHAREMNWDPKDMRKFKPLGHTDAQGRVLQSTGLQLRTAMGLRSVTSRKLDLSSFPNSMRDEAGLGRDGAVIWFSFLAQSFNTTSENSRFTYLQLGSRDVSGFRIGKLSAAPSGNWTAMGLMTGGQVNLRSSSVPSAEMAFLVTRLEFREGPEDAVVWINPSLAAEPKLADATLRLSVPDFRFDGISINANYSTDIDEIRFGQSFRAVAPVK